MAGIVAINSNMDNLRRSALRYTSICEYEDMQELCANFLSSKGLTYTPKQASLLMLQEKLLNNGGKAFPPRCPFCGHRHAVLNGTLKNGLICYKCKNCNKKYSVLTGTILENSHLPWYIVAKILQMTINNDSLREMVNILEKDYGCKGITQNTVWQWRMKLMRALASMPQPYLTGVIQIDETYIRECQKGSRNLQSYLPHEDRLPRKGHSPSKYGILSPEFCNVVTAVDDSGHCVCKVLEMGYLSKEKFYFSFDRHILAPKYICTDNNPVYSMYCRAKGYNHYIRPSTYQAILKNSGYNNEENLTAAQKEKNHKIRKALYREGCIDRIEPGVYNYEEFCGIRNDEGLSLSRVNALHRDIKQRLVTQKFNVCSKFLSDYLGFYSFIHNWTIDHNGVVPSSNADATEILLLILKQQKPFTWQAINDTELKLPQPNRRFLKMLAEKTFAGRQALGSPFLKFNEEEGASPLQQRKFLCSLGEKELRKVCRANHIIGYSNFSIGGIIHNYFFN